jgi:rhamnosyltransferase
MISIIIPTLNAEGFLGRLFQSLRNQSTTVDEVIIVDSSSDDNTVALATSLGATVIVVNRGEFDHGATRTIAGKKAKGEILIYLTQDVVLVNDSSIENLVKPFYFHQDIGAAYGKQLPCLDATPYGAHLRYFNYPAISYIRDIHDKNKYGIKTAFLSNSFTAYRKTAMDKIGWFKENIILGEDTYAGAKLLLSGYKLAYIAEATVYHSHNYSLGMEFKRYFDIGVFHKTETWILNEFGKATGAGFKYIGSELSYLFKHKQYLLIPQSFLRSCLKFAGYIFGQNYDKLPLKIIKRLSMHGSWWNCKKKSEIRNESFLGGHR